MQREPYWDYMRRRLSEEDMKESLEVGKLADLVILDKNPTIVDPMTIIDIPIQRTMVGGKWSYES